MDVVGKSVLITGGSRGLGRALAGELAARGARVVLVARGREDLDEAVAWVKSRGGDAWGIVADVGDEESAARVAGQAAALAGTIDLVVLNASTLGPVPLAPLSDVRPEALERVFEVNVIGPFRLARALVGAMSLRDEGLVVAISSDAAVEAYPTWGAYGASKAAMDHLVRVWAAELDGTGVRFLAIDPGEMDTEMHAAAMPDVDPSELARPEMVATRIAEIIAREQRSGLRVEAARWEVRA